MKLLFILSIIISLSACGNDETKNDETVNNSGSDEVTTKDEQKPTDVTDDEKNQSDGSDKTELNDDSKDDSNKDDNSDTGNEDPKEEEKPKEEAKPSLYKSADSPDAAGSLQVLSKFLSPGEAGALKPTSIFYPAVEGSYPLVLFFHGFMLDTAYYKESLMRLASHGFIVVAPQMYEAGGLPIGKPTAEEETTDALKIVKSIEQLIKSSIGIEAAKGKVGFAGHSRGGKVIWKMLATNDKLASAVYAIDPVDGAGPPDFVAGFNPGLKEARVLDSKRSFQQTKVLIVGTGLGKEAAGFLGQACAPAGDNYDRFYSETSAKGLTQIIATEYGHMDMLDANINCGQTCSVCKAGPSPDLMRSFVRTSMNAFFKTSLQEDSAHSAYLSDSSKYSITLSITSK